MKNGAYILSEAKRLHTETETQLDSLVLNFIKLVVDKMEQKLTNHTISFSSGMGVFFFVITHKKAKFDPHRNGNKELYYHYVHDKSDLPERTRDLKIFQKAIELLDALNELCGTYNYYPPEYNPEAERQEAKKKREETKQKEYERQFKSMRPVPVELLKKMTAQRILAYYKSKWRNYMVRLGYEMAMFSRKGNPFVLNYVKTLKEIMKTKPHVPRKKITAKKKITKKR